MMRDINTQVLVIGSGPAGYSAAFRSADLGLKTILVEKYNDLGGVCLNVGCIPSKLLLHLARVIREVQEISKQGVFFAPPIIDFNKIKEHKNTIIKNLSSGIRSMAKSRKVDVLHGFGSFVNANVVQVINESEVINVHYENVIIATGSKPIQLPNINVDRKYIWDSNQALSLNSIPKRLLIIGSGIIGLEMATFYSSIGCIVDVIDRCNQVLPILDRDIMKVFTNSVKKYFNILLETKIEDIIIQDNKILVTVRNNNNQKSILYDAVLVAVGRTPNIQELKLESTGIKIDENGFIPVNDQLCTNIPNIYAIGDIIGPPMLAHKGIHQGHIAAEVIAGYKHYFEPIAIPSVSYTDPEIAWVGMSESDAISKNINYEVASFPWLASGRAVVSNCSNGITKLIINKDSKKILGGVIVGRNAGELLSEITLAMEMGCDIEDISLTIHPHPTLCESIGLSAQIFEGSITDLINLKSKILN